MPGIGAVTVLLAAGAAHGACAALVDVGRGAGGAGGRLSRQAPRQARPGGARGGAESGG